LLYPVSLDRFNSTVQAFYIGGQSFNRRCKPLALTRDLDCSNHPIRQRHLDGRFDCASCTLECYGRHGSPDGSVSLVACSGLVV